MKKAKASPDELRPEYSRTDFKTLQRGKYVTQLKATSNIVVIDPALSELFPNADAVNSALKSLAEIARRAETRRGRPR